MILSMPVSRILGIFLSFVMLVSCNRQPEPGKNIGSHYVEVREQNGRYQLYRNGAPYYIKGACIDKNFDMLKESGGNSIRIYNVQVDSALVILDQAQEVGLTVTVGLNLAPAHELDYSNENEVAAQQERIKKDIYKLKNHPALLMWGIGNELNSGAGLTQFLKHYRLWRAVNNIAKIIHEIDPNHPTTTMIPTDPTSTLFISLFCSDIDILSLNVFIKKKLPFYTRLWNGPVLVSEYNSFAYWNKATARTEWYAKLEPTSSSKVKTLQTQYQELINNNRDKCLGAYVFFWGQKQEYTTTYFGLFTEKGNPTEVIDAMQHIWTSKWPANRAPGISSLTINQKQDSRNIYLEAGQKYKAEILARDNENDSLQLNWEIQKDNTEIFFNSRVGQPKPEVIAEGKLNFENFAKNKPAHTPASHQKFNLEFIAPTYEGPYRLFIYLTNKNQKTATSNAAFYVIN